VPSQSHSKAADLHESAAKSHRAAAEHHGKNDHTKGDDHAAQKHSNVAGAASDQAHAKSSSNKK
jgi:hypothetical protein